ncbi:MAG TPA: DNA repair protein RadC [Thiotrichales bacterium]|nr:DNA repair protein RadC [Thiotrichales bacterium]
MMQNVLPLTFDTNRFAEIQTSELSENEQASLVKLALAVLQERHQRGECLNSPKATRDYLHLLLSERRNEAFGALFLDSKHRLILCEERMFQGTLDGASIYPRVVVQRALACNAAAVIFFHNHPSGVPEPSGADQAITQKLKDVLSLIDVRVLDHIVVGHEGTVSFAERGIL